MLILRRPCFAPKNSSRCGAFKAADQRPKADIRASKILENTTTHDSERYIVGMLWSDDNVILSNSFFTSFVGLKFLEKHLDKDTELKAQYTKTLNDDIEKGCFIRVNDFRAEKRTSQVVFWPHHPVLNPKKPGQARRVLNGAPQLNDKPLNNVLSTGSDLLQDLFNVLLRLRPFHFAVSTDA